METAAHLRDWLPAVAYRQWTPSLPVALRWSVLRTRGLVGTVQDVVTYGAVIVVDNLKLALKPGMTASVRIRTASAKSTDSVPNAALSFTPPGTQRPPKTNGVYVLEGATFTFTVVEPGISDGESTAIAAGALPAAAKVLIDLTPEGKLAYGLGHKA